jgi:hypothetical protein
MRDNLRRVRDFRTDSPADLKRQLSALEDNVSAMGGHLLAALQPVLASRGTNRDAVALAPGQFVTVDTAAGDVGVSLDAPTSAFAGKWALLIKLAAANAVNLTTQGGTIDLGAVLAITSAGAHLLFCDGSNYWSV